MKTRTKVALWLLMFFGPVWWVVPIGLRGREATVSEKTTRITAPLTADGLPDYAAWLNAKHGVGVTSENNAAAALVDAWEEKEESDWPEETKKEQREKKAALRRKLGAGARAEGLPWMEDYFFSWAQKKGLENLREEGLRQAKDNGDQLWVDLENDIVAKPWTAAQHPDAAQWLEEQQVFWKMLEQAVRRPRFFMPWETAKPLLTFETRHLSGTKKITNFGRVRVMWHLGAGRVEAALDDIETTRRTALLLAKDETTLIGLLVARSIAAMADQEFAAVAQQVPKGHPAWARLERMAADPTADFEARCRQVIMETERFMGLDTMLRLWRWKSDPSVANAFINPFSPLPEALAAEAGPLCRQGDADAMLDRLNGHYEVLYPLKPLAKADEKAEEEARKQQVAAGLLRIGCVPPGLRRKKAGELAADVAHAFSAGVFHAVARQFSLAPAAHAHLPVALALAKYRLDHGRYPATLGELVPDYLAQLPEAKHDFGTIIYRTAGVGQAFSIAYVNPEEWQDGQLTPDARPREFLESPDFWVLMEADKRAEKAE